MTKFEQRIEAIEKFAKIRLQYDDKQANKLGYADSQDAFNAKGKGFITFLNEGDDRPSINAMIKNYDFIHA